MSELHIPDEAFSAGWHELRYPRPATDEPGESFKRAVRAAAPIILAAELRRLADAYDEPARTERQRANRLANGAPKWQHEAAITSYQELAGFARRLRARADELDGGTR